MRSVLFMTASKTAIRRRRGSSSTTIATTSTVRVDLDERLDHALAERPVAQDRRRDDAPADRLGHVPGGHLAAGQRPVGEVVERPLAERSACRPRRATAAGSADPGRSGSP